MKQFYIVPDLADAGPYAHAVCVDDIVYTSAVMALDRDGRLVAPGDVVAQARQIYENLGRILRAAGAAWCDVVKVNHFVMPPGIDRGELAMLQAVMADYLPQGQQAGTDICFGPVHAGQRLQVEVIAHPGHEKRILGGRAGPLWAEGVRSGRHLFLSGRIAGPSGSVREQTADIYAAFDRLTAEAGMDWRDLVRVRQFVSVPATDFNEVRNGRLRYVPAGTFTSTSVCSLPGAPLPAESGPRSIAADLQGATGVRIVSNISAMPVTPATAHAVTVGGLVHLQAEIATDADDAIVFAGDIAAQARYIYQNMTKLLTAAGCDWGDVVTSRIFCREGVDIATVRQIERLWAGAAVFARSDVVCGFFHADALLEVELTAARA